MPQRVEEWDPIRTGSPAQQREGASPLVSWPPCSLSHSSLEGPRLSASPPFNLHGPTSASLGCRRASSGIQRSPPRASQVPVGPRLQTTPLRGAGWAGGQTGCSFCRPPKVPFRPEAWKGGRERLWRRPETRALKPTPQHWRLKGAAQHRRVEGRPGAAAPCPAFGRRRARLPLQDFSMEGLKKSREIQGLAQPQEGASSREAVDHGHKKTRRVADGPG